MFCWLGLTPAAQADGGSAGAEIIVMYRFSHKRCHRQLFVVIIIMI